MEHNMCIVLMSHLGVVLDVFRACKKDFKSDCASKLVKVKNQRFM